MVSTDFETLRPSVVPSLRLGFTAPGLRGLKITVETLDSANNYYLESRLGVSTPTQIAWPGFQPGLRASCEWRYTDTAL